MQRSVLHFGNPARLQLKHGQILIERPGEPTLTRPLEDIGCIVIDHDEVSLTTPLIAAAAQAGVALIICDDKHMPTSLSLGMENHHVQNLRHRQQWEAGAVAYKQAWQQIIRAKLSNQAALLERLGIESARLRKLAREVKSGDSANAEAQGARHYWAQIFGQEPDFYRDRYGPPPNHLLNYGYAILRAATARALAGAGLCLSIGVHHHHQANAFALADDMMESYRPWVDQTALQLWQDHRNPELDKPAKAALLAVLHQDVQWESSQSPLLLALDTSAASLAAFFAGASTQLLLPAFPHA